MSLSSERMWSPRRRHTAPANGNIDIVLVGSDSLETVKITHSTYFAGASKVDLRSLLRLDELTAHRS